MAITWDEYFMGIAVLSSMRSKDPNPDTKVGACIVSSNKIIVGVGFNGAPRGWNDAAFPWNREGEGLDVKCPYVIHAELNAILNSSIKDLKGATIYVTEFPCNECTKAIAQTGIVRIIYLNDKYANTNAVKAAKKMCDILNISYVKFKPTCGNLEIKFL